MAEKEISEERKREMSIDWEASRIPLEAWKTCLSSAELWIKGKHYGAVDVVESKANLISGLGIFYLAVCSEYAKYLNSKTYNMCPLLRDFNERKLRSLDYDKLPFSLTKDVDDRLLYYMFLTLTWWAQQFGPFRTFNKVIDPAEALLYD